MNNNVTNHPFQIYFEGGPLDDVIHELNPTKRPKLTHMFKMPIEDEDDDMVLHIYDVNLYSMTARYLGKEFNSYAQDQD